MSRTFSAHSLKIDGMFPRIIRCCLLGSLPQRYWRQAPSSAALSLEAAYQLATDQRVLAIAQYRVDSAEAQMAEARGAVLPQLSLFGEWSENNLRYDGALGALYDDQDYPGERYGFQARQTLFNMSQFRELQRRDALFDRSGSDLAQAEIELLAQVTDAYITVLVADNTVSQFQVESEALEKQLAEAQALYSRALIPLTQVLETQTRSETVKADLIEAEGGAAIARERLTELIGVRDFELMDIAEEVSLTARMVTAEQAVAEALLNSPAVAAAEDSADAAEFGIKREQGSWLPEVSWYKSSILRCGLCNLTLHRVHRKCVECGELPRGSGGRGFCAHSGRVGRILRRQRRARGHQAAGRDANALSVGPADSR